MGRTMSTNGQLKQLQQKEVYPYNQCLYHAVQKQDPTSPIIQNAYVLITIVSSMITLVLPQIVMMFGVVDSSWDEIEGLTAFDIEGFLKATLDMNTKLPLIITVLYLFTLPMLDFLGFDWPKSWH